MLFYLQLIYRTVPRSFSFFPSLSKLCAYFVRLFSFLTLVEASNAYLRLLQYPNLCCLTPHNKVRSIESSQIKVTDQSTTMDLTCVVRRDIKILCRRKCHFSDSILKANQCVDIYPDPELAATYTTSKNKEIGIQCLACNVSALQVYCYQYPK